MTGVLVSSVSISFEYVPPFSVVMLESSHLVSTLPSTTFCASSFRGLYPPGFHASKTGISWSSSPYSFTSESCSSGEVAPPRTLVKMKAYVALDPGGIGGFVGGGGGVSGGGYSIVVKCAPAV